MTLVVLLLRIGLAWTALAVVLSLLVGPALRLLEPVPLSH